MNAIVFLVMRRMRQPLLILISIYALAVFGMTVIPGPPPEGSGAGGTPLGIFHAFYFVSYMGTTIGFGEFPDTFSDAQRIWVLISLYLTVVSWVYAIGALIALLQDNALRQALIQGQFRRTVLHIREPFYLICGYGDTGRTLVSALEERYMRSVVVELSQERINLLTLENYPIYVPKICADAAKPESLLDGGLQSRYCAGVVAITNDNEVNLHIAITAKLLNPGIRTICRVDSREVRANMESFGTDHTIDPFDTFAIQLHTALHNPSLHLLREWLTGITQTPLSKPLNPPRRGLWILCGYGRFGKALYQQLEQEPGIDLMVVEATPHRTGLPSHGGFVEGWGTDSITLRQARITEAVGIVAGTDNDVNNLSILMTARALNPGLFIVARQNLAANEAIFLAAQAHIVMHPSTIIASRIRVLLTTPLLVRFFYLAKRRGEAWASRFYVYYLSELLDSTTPYVWELSINADTTPAVCELLHQHQTVTLDCLLRDPRDRRQRLACIPLYLVRANGEEVLLPEETEALEIGDTLLWCGRGGAQGWMSWSLYDSMVLHYLSSGISAPRSYVWRWGAKLWRQWVDHKFSTV